MRKKLKQKLKKIKKMIKGTLKLWLKTKGVKFAVEVIIEILELNGVTNTEKAVIEILRQIKQ